MPFWGWGAIICVGGVCIIILDLAGKINLAGPWVLAPALVVLPHLVLLYHWLARLPAQMGAPAGQGWFFVWPPVLLALYGLGKLFFCPLAGRLQKNAGFRPRALMHSRYALLWGLYGMAALGLVYAVGHRWLLAQSQSPDIFWTDVAVATAVVIALAAWGLLRMLCLSWRLMIVPRLLILLTLWVPLVNLAGMLWACRAAREEYLHACDQASNRETRAHSAVCQTRYPIMMVHGVGFRDLKYVNYWGRIPRELTRNGAVIAYGNQEAWGTVEDNAQDLKEAVLWLMSETGSEKVNIIAHSKGGLDSRYMISQLDMGGCVASLTTINSPHRGSRVIDVVYGMPRSIYRRIAAVMDGYFRWLGDKRPNFLTASGQFTTTWCEHFNARALDDSRVYYQSYMSVMQNPFSDFILSVPFCIVKAAEGPNDGLVAPSAANWGQFKGTFKSGTFHGISHGDMIDLRRRDYRGFDVVEAYVKIVAELKKQGF